jgi:hypothetical protein
MFCGGILVGMLASIDFSNSRFDRSNPYGTQIEWYFSNRNSPAAITAGDDMEEKVSRDLGPALHGNY